jgi:hypothetical protein
VITIWEQYDIVERRICRVAFIDAQKRKIPWGTEMEDDVSVIVGDSIARYNHGNLVSNWEVVSASIAVFHYMQGHRCIWNISGSSQDLVRLLKYRCITMCQPQ